jgi:hypothetical protein
MQPKISIKANTPIAREEIAVKSKDGIDKSAVSLVTSL